MKLASFLLLSAADLAAAITPISQLRSNAWFERQESKLAKRAAPSPATLYPPYNISIPIDHFPTKDKYAPHTSESFNLRYYFDASHYKPGGPVITLLGGETSATGRLSFLQKGMLAQLVNETNGIGVVMEHRYYGTSIPVANLTNESLRFLTTETALADVDYFARNIKFPGLEHLDLTAPKTPWIIYGGSYAGGQAAFLRKVYPDTFWGTIASSGVTYALWDYWQYYDLIRQFGPKQCISLTQKLVNVVDNILIKVNDTKTTETLKAAFNLANFTHVEDFANALSSGISGWQGRNWDPALNSPTTDLYCGNLTANTILYPQTAALKKTAEDLIKIGGWGKETKDLVTPLLNYFGWINLTVATPCTSSGASLDDCYSYYNAEFWGDESVASWSARSWTWQYCTEWGYLQTGNVPKGQLPIISRTIDLDYNMLSCELSFNITGPPDLDLVNKYGGYKIAADRLAFIDGEADPWRPVTPHADWAPKRRSTVDRPFEIITGGAVHHWDENGLFPNETTATLPPPSVKRAQRIERQFVKAWLEDFETYRKQKGW